MLLETDLDSHNMNNNSDLITQRTDITSFHPFQYTSKMKMMITICEDLWVLFIIFCGKYREVLIVFDKKEIII